MILSEYEPGWENNSIQWHPFDPKVNRLWLDCDGVLADFDTPANAHLGMYTREYEEKFGTDAFWAKIGEIEDFYRNLPLLPDALELYDAVAHLRPGILTGAPSHLGEKARHDKFAWAHDKFGVFQRVVVCRSKDKAEYCVPGDIIVDDWPKHRRKWESAGGTWVHHTSAEDSIAQLKEMGIIR